MNFMNRKLFKGRAARDKLNKMGGIMASSQPLMNTVQNFNLGGNVKPRPLPRAISSFGGSATDFRALPDEMKQRVLAAENRNRQIARGLMQSARPAGVIPDALMYTGAKAAEGVMGLLQDVGLADPTKDYSIEAPSVTGTLREKIGLAQGFDKPVDMEAAIAMQRATLDPSIENMMNREDLQGLDPITGERPQVPGMSTAPPARGDADPEVEPEFQSDFTDTRRLTDGAARDKFAAGPVAQDPALAAAKKGEQGAAAQMAAIVTEGTESEVEMTLEQLMSEFTSAAPEREGMDKGLAIAKIGFAMAAGQSPDAISNIATALMGGADMFIKDKAEKDAFDRQVKLSALQYGLGEIGKRRAQARTDARTFRAVVPTTDGVMTLTNGTKIPYKANETVNVPMSEIVARKGQLPEGLSGQDKEVFLANEAAILQRQKTFAESLKDARKELVIEDKRQLEIIKNYGKDVDSFIQAEVGGKFIEEALLNIAENGDYILGLPGAGAATFNDFANALGIDPGKKFESKAQLQKSVGLGFQSLIKSYFAKSQSANSISNFDVTSLADAYIDAAFVQDANGNFNLATKDEDVLVGSLQEVLKQFARDQRAAMTSIQSYENMLQGRILPGQGTLKDPFSEGTAEQALVPLRERLNPFLGEKDQRLPEFQGERSTEFLVPVEVEETGGMKRFKIPGLS